MSKEFDGMTVNFKIKFDSLNVQFGDTNSTNFYNPDVAEALELDFEDDGEGEETAKSEDACECGCCKAEKNAAADKPETEMPESGNDFFKQLLEGILAEMK